MEPSRDDVEMLLFHYKMIRGDVNLLMNFCAKRGVSLMDGFRDVIDAINRLQEQLREMDKK